MNIFKDYVFHWWEAAMLKASLLSIGIAIGATYSDDLLPYRWALVALGLFLGCALALRTFMRR